MSNKLTQDDVDFIDFSKFMKHNDSTKIYEHLLLLLENLKTRYTHCGGFWTNKNEICSNTFRLVIAVDKQDEMKQLGFAVAKSNQKKGVEYIHFIESFIPGRGLATLLLDYIAYRNPVIVKSTILICKPLEQAMGFWTKYLAHNQSAGMKEWWTNGKEGTGPLLNVYKILTGKDLVMLMNLIKTKFGAVKVYPSKDDKTCFIHVEAPNHNPRRAFSLTFFENVYNRHWPSSEKYHRKNYEDSTSCQLMPGEYKIALKFKGDDSLFGNDFDDLKECFETVGITMNFIL